MIQITFTTYKGQFNRLQTDLPGMPSMTHLPIDLVGATEVDQSKRDTALYGPLRKLVDPVVAFDSELAGLSGGDAKPALYKHPFFFLTHDPTHSAVKVVGTAFGYDLSSLLEHEQPHMKDVLDGDKTAFLAALFGQSNYISQETLAYAERTIGASGLYTTMLSRTPETHAAGRAFFKEKGYAEYCMDGGFVYLLKSLPHA